ncbi:cupin domain-containing protein [Myxococcus sp. RHSTA-1-4]|uniref:cupin domain-containing protein n=1 Tax=Myxococcus sp. RHSTA-1-4 TaxID=2874601 RepID=UPI001CBFA520|nr:cupin domain-containing protein [Myxococcus sp. RHSTA-1-4]MBZ4420508.1 cupin domain-containing protein [Myxococcus sp. RHSTA-1-4]
MRSRFLIPVLAAGLGTATLAWAREPAPQAASASTKSATPASPPTASSAKSAAASQPAASSANPAAAAQRPTSAPAKPATPASQQAAPGAAPASGAVRYRVPTSEAPRHIIAGGKGRATLLLNPSTGATAASMTLLELQPGAEVPEHVHDTSAEILYIEDGAAEMTVSGEKVRVAKGDAVYIPAGVKHSARVVSPDAALKAVQVYAGPGPELRFTQGPRENPPHGR